MPFFDTDFFFFFFFGNYQPNSSDKGGLTSLPSDLNPYLLRKYKLLSAHFKPLIACKTNERYQVSLEKLEAFKFKINRIQSPIDQNTDAFLTSTYF